VGLRNYAEEIRVSLKTIVLNSIAVILLTSSCSQTTNNSTSSDELNPPVIITVKTQGRICELIREGFEASELSSVAAIGDCLEQTAINGGRALWFELSDLSTINPNITDSDLKTVMVSVALATAAYGFRASDISPTEFEQLYFAFRDAKGSNFEISPADMQKLLPTKDISQEEWEKLVETETTKLIPKITIRSLP
jgi:hypothetical protein